MKENVKKRIADEIRVIASKLSDLPRGEKVSLSEVVTFFNLPGGPKHLNREYAPLYYNLMRSFLKEKSLASGISLQLLHNLFESLLTEYLSREHKTDDVVNLIAKLESDALARIKTWHYYIPLEGVILKTPDIAFGQHLLFQMDRTRRDSLADQFFRIIDQRPVDDANKALLKDIVESDFEKASDFIDKACIRLEIEGDRFYVREVALTEALTIAQILTFVGHGHSWSTRKCRIGFGAAFTKQMQHFPIVSVDSTSAVLSSEWPPDSENLEIDDDVLAKLKKLGLDALIQIYSKRNSGTSEIEKTLLRAIQFFYNGYTALDRVSEYVNYFIVLEIFLSPSDREQLSKTIAEGIAILFETDCEKRIKLKKHVKNLYNKRSGLVHGKTDRIDKFSVEDVQYLAYKLIQMVLENRNTWEKRGDIEKHIDRIKFS